MNPGVSPLEDIVALGNDSPLGPGFAIYGEHTWGGHATFAVAPSRNVVPRPAGRTWEESAAYPLASLTAYRMLRRARLRAGQTVLVVGIGSGVSCAALAIARQLGAEVVATSRSEAKRAEALAMGAVAAIDSADERWPVQADVVVESVGAATWDKSVRALKAGGRLVVCGGTSGAEVALSLPRLFFKQFEIIGSSMGSYEEFAEVTALMAQGLDVRVDEVVELSEYPAALARLEAGEQLGKIVLASLIAFLHLISWRRSNAVDARTGRWDGIPEAWACRVLGSPRRDVRTSRRRSAPRKPTYCGATSPTSTGRCSPSSICPRSSKGRCSPATAAARRACAGCSSTSSSASSTSPATTRSTPPSASSGPRISTRRSSSSTATTRWLSSAGCTWRASSPPTC